MGASAAFGGEQFLEMRDVVVAEHALLAARVADARDHDGMVEFVGEDDAAGQELAERRQRRVVRDVAAGEQQRAFLAVQIGKLMLELDMVMRVAADVARAAGAGADIVQRLFHRRDHLGMLAHREVIVRAPHGDRLGPVMMGEAARIGERALVAQDVDEHAIAAFGMKPVDRLVENLVVVQRTRSVQRRRPCGGRGVPARLNGCQPRFKARSLRGIRIRAVPVVRGHKSSTPARELPPQLGRR